MITVTLSIDFFQSKISGCFPSMTAVITTFFFSRTFSVHIRAISIVLYEIPNARGKFGGQNVFFWTHFFFLLQFATFLLALVFTPFLKPMLCTVCTQLVCRTYVDAMIIYVVVFRCALVYNNIRVVIFVLIGQQHAHILRPSLKPRTTSAGHVCSTYGPRESAACDLRG